MLELTKAQRKALRLCDPSISCDDRRCGEFSDDGDPDTWNTLFRLGLAEQRGPGWSGDDFSIHITPAGRAALSPAAGIERPREAKR
jgi:hypothetical protein